MWRILFCKSTVTYEILVEIIDASKFNEKMTVFVIIVDVKVGPGCLKSEVYGTIVLISPLGHLTGRFTSPWGHASPVQILWGVENVIIASESFAPRIHGYNRWASLYSRKHINRLSYQTFWPFWGRVTARLGHSLSAKLGKVRMAGFERWTPCDQKCFQSRSRMPCIAR